MIIYVRDTGNFLNIYTNLLILIFIGRAASLLQAAYAATATGKQNKSPSSECQDRASDVEGETGESEFSPRKSRP